MKIFIVDDSPVIRERLTSTLSEVDGVEFVGEASNGIEARVTIPELKPDLVILDIRMPQRNGIDVLRDVKTTIPALKVIILTNYPYPQYRKKFMEEGVEFFFDKSTEFNKVPEVIKQLLQNSKQ